MGSLYDLQVKCNECGEVSQPEPPENRLKWILGMVIIFGGLGLAVGLVTGVATAGAGFAAWGFTIPLGIYAGYKIGSYGAELLDGPSCPSCNHAYGTGSLLPF